MTLIKPDRSSTRGTPTKTSGFKIQPMEPEDPSSTENVPIRFQLVPVLDNEADAGQVKVTGSIQVEIQIPMGRKKRFRS